MLRDKDMETGRPDFFLIGAPKCGTSALASYLSEHPSIFFSIPKEPAYWCSDYPEHGREMGMRSLDDYLELFRGVKPHHLAAGEGSTRYLCSEVAVPRILEFAPDGRFIVMLRNPVDAAQSIHAELLFRFEEDVADFESAWHLQSERKAGGKIPRNCQYPEFLQYGRMSSYSWQVERLLSRVRRHKVCFVLFDDFASDPRTAYQQVLGFLGVPDDNRTDFPKVRGLQSHRFPRLSRWLMSPPPPFRSTITWLKNRVRRSSWGVQQFGSALKVKQPKAELRPEFANELRDYFRADVVRLSELLNRDLTHWTHQQAKSSV